MLVHVYQDALPSVQRYHLKFWYRVPFAQSGPSPECLSSYTDRAPKHFRRARLWLSQRRVERLHVSLSSVHFLPGPQGYLGIAFVWLEFRVNESLCIGMRLFRMGA